MKLHDSDWIFLRRLLSAAAVVVGIYLVWKLSFILLLVFASILVATLLSGFTNQVAQHSFLSRRWALATTTIGLLVCLAAASLLFGSQLASQLTHVFERAPDAIDAAGRWIGISNAADRVTQALSQSGLVRVKPTATPR